MILDVRTRFINVDGKPRASGDDPTYRVKADVQSA